LNDWNDRLPMEQPLWKPAQPQSEHRHLIPPDSFFLLLLGLWETLFCELHLGQRSILAGIKVSLWILKRFATTSMNESMDGRN
jgi:hypothetical protein